jgi:hypothetical protein
MFLIKATLHVRKLNVMKFDGSNMELYLDIIYHNLIIKVLIVIF